MADVLEADLVYETSTGTGTGTLNLAGRVGYFRSFVSGYGSTNLCYYAIRHQTADEWEVGVGVVTSGSPDTLTRQTVLSSSNSGSLVNFSAGVKNVQGVRPANLFTMTSRNPTFGDADGDRKCRFIAKGYQSGGEESTLGEWEFSHDGAGDDQKGKFIVRLNDGNDGTSPTAVITALSSGYVGFGCTPAAKLELRDGDLLLSDADVAHGMTDVFPTTAYGLVGIADAARGGLFVRGATDVDYNVAGVTIDGILGTDNPTDAYPALLLRGWKKNGTAIQALGATETVMQLSNGGTPIITLLGSGNVGVGQPPNYPLDVKLIENFVAFGGDDNVSGHVTGIRLGYNPSGNAYNKAGIFWEATGDANARGKLHIALDVAADSGNATISDAVMTFYNGYVGVGGTPMTKLNVFGESPILRLTDTQSKDWSQNDVIAEIQAYRTDPSDGGPKVTAKIAIISDFAGQSTMPMTAFVFYTEDAYATVAERMRLSSSGFFGLGESTPGTLFDMAGTSPYLTTHNTAHTDSDGARISKWIAEGEQSGGELTTLGEIEFSHDGASDDEKGKMVVRLNDGNDGTSPTVRLTLKADGGLILSTIKSGANQGAAGAAAGELWKTASHATLPDNVVMIGV